MQVEADDPEGDWTRPGVFEVDPGVYRIPLPLPHDGLRAVNVYAIAGDDGCVLIDAGWGLSVSRDALDKGLAALGLDLRAVGRLLVTHAHRDHYGQAVALRREFGMTVSLGAGEGPSMAVLGSAGHRALADQWAPLARYGADELLAWVQANTDRIGHNPADWAGPDDWLETGQELTVPARLLRVVATPGHTQGHVVFVDDEAGLLFAGDHVLPHITPSIGFEPVPVELVLGDYLDSLLLVRASPDRRLLPAHGPTGGSVHTRIDELLDHHSRRLDEAFATVGADAPTAFESAQRLTWTKRRKAFAELDLFNQMLAVAEAAAHLDLLVAQGRLRAVQEGVVRRYLS